MWYCPYRSDSRAPPETKAPQYPFSDRGDRQFRQERGALPRGLAFWKLSLRQLPGEHSYSPSEGGLVNRRQASAGAKRSLLNREISQWLERFPAALERARLYRLPEFPRRRLQIRHESVQPLSRQRTPPS